MPKSKQICKKFTIVCRGNDDGDIEQAFEEAARLVSQGCLTGNASNDTGAFYFEVDDKVAKKNWPA